MKVSIFRKEHFNAAHRLFNSTWSDEKNDAVFGKCNNPNYHGHNYDLIVQLVGEIDPEGRLTVALLKLMTPLLNPILAETEPLTKCNELFETYILSQAAVGEPKLKEDVLSTYGPSGIISLVTKI